KLFEPEVLEKDLGPQGRHNLIKFQHDVWVAWRKARSALSYSCYRTIGLSARRRQRLQECGARGNGMKKPIDRRMALGGVATAPLLAGGAFAADKPQLATPPSVITNPPRAWGPDATPNVFPDPDVIPIDPAFNRLIVRYSPIKRLGTGYLWAEGPAWSSEGIYLLFSDVQGNVQYRLIWETGDIVPFRKPSFYSNGNCFDFQGRQLS